MGGREIKRFPVRVTKWVALWSLATVVPTQVRAQWTTDVNNGAIFAQSAFSVPTITGEIARLGSGSNAGATARAAVLCALPGGELFAIILPQGAEWFPAGKLYDMRISVDRFARKLTGTGVGNVLTTRASAALVDRLKTGGSLTVRVGAPPVGHLTWRWSLGGSRRAIERAC